MGERDRVRGVSERGRVAGRERERVVGRVGGRESGRVGGMGERGKEGGREERTGEEATAVLSFQTCHRQKPLPEKDMGGGGGKGVRRN